jgi:hypothetical protein
MMKAIDADGSMTEIEVSFEVWKFHRDDFWQND